MFFRQPAKLAFMLKALREIVFPQFCIVCGAPDADVCSVCLETLQPRRTRIENIPLVIAVHDRSFMPAVAVWKDQRTRSLTPAFAQLVVRALPPRASGYVAPIPSRASSQLIRGWSPVADLAREVARLSHLECRPHVLTWNRAVGEQRRLSDSQRMRNLDDAFECEAVDEPIWILDDVSTSGATLRAAIAAAQQADVHVAGCLVLVAPRSRF